MKNKEKILKELTEKLKSRRLILEVHIEENDWKECLIFEGRIHELEFLYFEIMQMEDF